MLIMDYEVAVVGGSHAGLAAAHTLGRSKRRTIVFDTGKPRNLSSTRSHNFSGHDGVSPVDLRAAALNDLYKFGHVMISPQAVVGLSVFEGGYQLTTDQQQVITVRKIILATGVTDHLLPIEGLQALWGRKVFHCTYCHGWEVRDQPALVLVKGMIAWEVAMSLSQWNSQLTFLLHGTAVEDAAKRDQLLQKGWPLIETPVVRIAESDTGLIVSLADGQIRTSPVVYTKPIRVQFNNELAVLLGCELSRSGSVLTDAAMQTSVPGVFAAGDLAHPGYHQVSEAISTGHKAAAFCNNQLSMEDFMG
ncbi:NAD(P)/FAD-dependent oxidoreductase [Paraflavitalea soli]|uniref:NAD(P)/FAD-dependent oxidoreductase n=1 Tax=Paraflavitalea soli TaxID=2315862 RepID=A0A3B7MKU0_9BACT|nr:NAD(P)/FAD-dependent oxidoreductase [Paraflavitalea soli]AXY74277.1 NAD(P)/FAD-dependent oxidoreductase [Paraflavitalea soli]